MVLSMSFGVYSLAPWWGVYGETALVRWLVAYGPIPTIMYSVGVAVACGREIIWE